MIKVLKEKNDIPTVILYEGRRYVLDKSNSQGTGAKYNGSKTVLQDAGKTRPRNSDKA